MYATNNESQKWNPNTYTLKNVNLSVPRGIIYGLLGPSGDGKTTLLKCMLGQTKIISGEMYLFGHKLGSPALDGFIPGPGIGYMPQEISLLTQPRS